MKRIKLNKGAELLLEKGETEISYFFVLFKAGWQSEKIKQLSHLTDHVILRFDVNNNGKVQKNMFLGKFKSDARTENDFMRLQFVVLNYQQLEERLSTINLMLNNVLITNYELEKEKQMIITEWETGGNNVEELVEPMAKITKEDVEDYINNNLTANNLQIYAISKIPQTELVKIFNTFITNLKTSKLNNCFENEQKTWDDLHMRVPDLSKPREVELNKDVKKTPFKFIASKKSKEYIIDWNYYVNVKYHNYLEQAKLNALELYIADFVNGIKKKLRHEKGLVYRTNHDFVPAVEQACIKTRIFVSCDKLKQTMKETKKYFKNLAKMGLTDDEFKILKEDFEYSAYTRPTFENKQLNYFYNKKDYLNEIKQMELYNFNAFIKRVINKRNLHIVVSAINYIYKDKK